MKTIYLDNAASTPLRHEVLDVMLPHLENSYGNPSSIHHQGRRAHDVLSVARKNIADRLKIQPSEIIFTSGGTEANNLALFGVAHAHRHSSDTNSTSTPHILVSSIEHDSILEASTALKNEGFDIEYIPVDANGRIDVAQVLSRVRTETILISVMLANNEIGTIQPIQELGTALNEKFSVNERPLLHTDACQATGHITIQPDILHVDLMTLNSSKIYGPKGVGMLYVRTGTFLTPILIGGGQEFGIRAGTENVPTIVGFSHALTLALDEAQEYSKNLTVLRDNFIQSLLKKIPGCIRNGHPTERLANNIHVSIPDVEGESIILMLDTYGICASTGSACNADSLLPSHVLRAIGQNDTIIHGSVRFSLGKFTTEEDLVYTADAVSKTVEKLRSLSPSPLHL